MRTNTISACGQRGIALFVGLVFLMVLSIVAMMAMRGTLVEMKMVTNTARHEAAFEASETLRAIPITLFDEHVFARGWPTSLNGDLPDSEFTYGTELTPSLLAKVKDALQTDCGTGETTLFYGQLQPACNSLPAETLYDPATWHPDLVIAICDAGGTSCEAQVSSTLSIVPDGASLSTGSGGAQAAGYRGLGVGSAGGGADLYFEVRSVATAPGNGVAITHTQYREKIRN